MYDLIIIGSGPAGLSAAVYAKRSGLELLVVEGNAMSGGQVLNTYEVDNYLGLPGIDGFEMGQTFRKHADKLGVTFKNAQVTSIENKGNVKVVHTRKEDIEAKALIIATGAEHSKLNILGEDKLTGKGVSYCATCDGAFFRGKTAAVVGGGDVALEDAIYLTRMCEKVYLIHRRDELRGAYVLQEELKSLPNAEILYSHTVESINGDAAVSSITIKDVKTGETKDLPTSALFVAVGIHPTNDLVKDILDCDDSGYVLADESGKTNVPGIFVAGDIRKKPLRQIVTAVADGANAVTSALEYLKK
ncbi:MAG: thioredoxin-disulfide reductase [Lachnospiraceae bacterium]|nr:thioredoxin-disulfide reductase [Lachnospiraceae bacterium]